MTPAIPLSMKTIESLKTRVATHSRATPFFSIRAVSLASSSADDYVQYKLAVTQLLLITGTTHEGVTHDAGKADDNAKVAWCLMFPKSPRLKILDFALTDKEVKSLVKDYNPTDPQAQLDEGMSLMVYSY